MYKTAESVTPGHPDKMCDQISDAILDHFMSFNPEARCAIEVMGGHKVIHVIAEIGGVPEKEIREDAVKALVWVVMDMVGYDSEDYEIRVDLHPQSSEIAQGVDTGGAGDQGIMVGYATRETPEFLPLELVIAREITKVMYTLSKEKDYILKRVSR